MSPRQVQVWFQNKRQRERKISRAKGMLSTPGLPDTPATQAAIAAARKERERSGSLGPDDEEDDGLVLPLHQRLRLLKKGEKLSFDDAALSRDEIAKSFSNGEELDEELLQALLEAQALGAVDRQAAAQAAGGPGGAAIRLDLAARTSRQGQREGLALRHQRARRHHRRHHRL